MAISLTKMRARGGSIKFYVMQLIVAGIYRACIRELKPHDRVNCRFIGEWWVFGAYYVWQLIFFSLTHKSNDRRSHIARLKGLWYRCFFLFGRFGIEFR